MYRNRDEFGRGRRWPRWPRSRPLGCLLWILILIVVLIILSVMFGGFQKGSKVNGLGASGPRVAVSRVAVEMPQSAGR